MAEAQLQQEEWKPNGSLAMITIAVMLATFVEVLNTSIANVALKTIAGSFSISNDESLWIITIFLIASSILLPATNWCCNVMGRKKFLLLCVAIFGISATVCGMATSFEMMIAGRIFQGLGGGCLLPLSQAILLESYPKNEKAKAMAIFSTGVTIAPIIGPILGGWLTTNYSWNFVFFISLPFCIVAFIMIAMHVEDPPYIKPMGLHKMDYIGMMFLIVWIATFQIMVDNGQKNGWFDSQYICKLGITSLIALIGLVWWELKTDKPLIDLKIFKNWNFTFSTILLTILFAVAFGAIAILPQFLQVICGYDSYLSGLAAGPQGIGAFLGVALTSMTAKKLELRVQTVIGLIIFSIGCLMFSQLNLNISMANVVIPNIVVGIGMTSVIIPSTTLVFSTVSNAEMTNAASVQNLIKNVGCAVGTSSVGVFVSRYSQVYQNYLVDRLTPLNDAFATKINTMTHVFASFGHDIATSNAMAHIMTYKQLLQQSMLCAYMMSFKIYALLILLVIPIAFVIKKVKFEG